MKLLPTTMVGSYPRPRWFRYQLRGRDVQEAFKEIEHAEAFEDATRTVIRDQELAGLDVLTDGQMCFDDYGMGIGSFLWYWFERIDGFAKDKRPHPARNKAKSTDVWALDEAGGVAVIGDIKRGPIRLANLYNLAQRNTDKPIKACVGAGPVQLSTMAHFEGGPIKNRYALSEALAGIFQEEIADLVAAGCKHIQLEDLGAWMPNLSGDKDFDWVLKIVNQTMAGIPDDVHTSWHFCLGNAWGNKLRGMTKGGYERILHRYHEANVDQFVLDFAARDMEDVALLADVPKDKGVAVGVIDVRSLEIEPDDLVAERIRQVLEHIEPERVWLTTDCGLKQLPRACAQPKLRALVNGANRVRDEL